MISLLVNTDGTAFIILYEWNCFDNPKGKGFISVQNSTMYSSFAVYKISDFGAAGAINIPNGFM